MNNKLYKLLPYYLKLIIPLLVCRATVDILYEVSK